MSTFPYQNPNPRTQNPIPRNPNPSIAFNTSVQPSSPVPVFYFENYPEEWTYYHLQQAFLKFGVSGRVTLARKKNVRNCRFGFFRPNPEENLNTVRSRLNNVSIGYYRIRAYPARYPTSQRDSFPVKGSKNIVSNRPAIQKQFSPSIRDDRSYAQVVDPMSFSPSEDSIADLSNSLIVKVKEFAMILRVSSYLEGKGIEFESLSLLGKDEILLKFKSIAARLIFESITFPSLKDFFVSFVHCGETSMSKGRYVWLNIVGLPICAWEEALFMQIGNHFGDAISVHPMVLSKERLDTGSVLISTSTPHIQDSVGIKIRGRTYTVHISESDIPISLLEDDISDSASLSSKDSLESVRSFSDQDFTRNAQNPNPTSVLAQGFDDCSAPAFETSINRVASADNVSAAKLPGIEVTPLTDSRSEKRLSSGPTPVDFNGFITQKRKSKRLDDKGNIVSTSKSNGGSDSSFSDGFIRHSNKRIVAEDNKAIVELEARKSWNLGLQLGLFSEANEQGIVELLSQAIAVEPRLLWPNLDFDYRFVPSVGASGTAIRFILCYASNCPMHRATLWHELLPELNTDLFCILVGDFNEILDPSERHNCSSFSSSMLAFSEFISASSLVESCLHGRFYTWHNSISCSKIDRCFLSPRVFSLWPNSDLKALPRCYSDHVPLLFNSDAPINWGPKPFKSINAWWSHKDFSPFIAESWANISRRLPSSNLVIKLRELRSVIKTWNREIFGDMNSKLLDTQLKISELESSADFQDLNDEDGARLSTLYSEFHLISKNLDSLWHQKSRLNWHSHGDKNSKYFHAMASKHSNSNAISEVLIDETCYNSAPAIKHQVYSFYRQLFSRSAEISYSLASLPIRQLLHSQAAALSIPFSEEEIYATLLGCDDNKAPGPDGFNYFFYKKAWKSIKGDLISLFQQFYTFANFPVGLNTAFLVLIPKFRGASDIKDFRPISLINGVFKLISKVLANRLSTILPMVISANQFGFIKGRSIHDCHMIATEIIHLIKKRREKAFLIKLDFRKAFDTISWQFIIQTLRRMNFDSKWISWITSFFDSAQLSVLLNGCPTENFFMGRGVRQGDPISPMLFVLAVENLRAIFSKAFNLGLLSGIHIDGIQEPVSILQFADDTLLFVPNDLNMISNLLRILRCFELISGLKINYQQSSIIGINVDHLSLSRASEILMCRIEELPITYLGMPLSERAIGAKSWDPVVSNFSSKLSTWRGNLLSPAGRLVLVKSVLSSLPVYYFSSLRIPQSVVIHLERIMRRFLWNGRTDMQGFSKVAWVDVCVPTSLGGLNITPLRIKNQFLLLKWLWKLLNSDRNSLWLNIVSCSSEISYCSDMDLVNTNKMSHLWKGIVSSCVKNKQIWNCFQNSISIEIGDGNIARFWTDKWLPSSRQTSPLYIQFPALFKLSRNKTGSVSSFFVHHQLQSSQFPWSRRLRIGEQEQFSELQQLLPSALHNVEDRFFWRDKRAYTAMSMKQIWFEIFQPNRCVSSFLTARIWKEKIPPRIQFFIWLLSRDRISSKEALARRGVIDYNLSSCSYCSLLETSTHIILHCNIAWRFWSRILNNCNVRWVPPMSAEDFFIQWASFSSGKYVDLWKLIWYFGTWNLWKARNKKVFQDEDVDIHSLVFLSICQSVEFYKFQHHDFPYSGNDVFRCFDFFCKNF
ncbi:uncharacterized protein LOC126681437 [Mercurialis annua]|uniref:uncharacterized protein LOC126681437 n=1 Tax=Mercurialis annua TaxID=3986 RepID=UPI00215EBA3A|nr:uncharacterized protein LOC126681437 [Mercurialis annua]